MVPVDRLSFQSTIPPRSFRVARIGQTLVVRISGEESFPNGPTQSF